VTDYREVLGSEFQTAGAEWRKPRTPGGRSWQQWGARRSKMPHTVAFL